MEGITSYGCTSVAQHGVSAFENMMSPQEVNALYICKHELRCGMDPLLIASTLFGHNWLTDSIHSQVTDMFRQGIEREQINEYLISHIPSSVNINNFVRVLDECGYRRTATHLYLTYITGGMRYVCKSTSGQRPAVHKFFRSLKRMVHDAQFQNPRLALRQLANRFVDQMQNENNPIRRQQLADKCIAIIGAEIDAIAITFDKHLHEHDVFEQMKQLVSETSNTSITDVVYFGRLANANSIAGDFQNSENMLTEARCRAYNTGPCLELVNMLYIEVYVKLWEFEKYPSEDLRKQLMMWGRIGLESLEEEDIDTKTLWRRMFILRMVFCLLGIGNRANMIENCPIDDTCLHRARELLSDIDRNWYGIETRRKMFYYVAKARLCELTGIFEECVDYIKVARKLATEGHFEELVFIIRYYERIVQKMDRTILTLMPKEQHPSRNFVLLRPDTSESPNAADQMCILAAADAEKKFLLLQITSETSVSLENYYNISEEFGSERSISAGEMCGFSVTGSYIPVACDDDRRIILLKSIPSEELNGFKSNLISEQLREQNNAEFLNVHTLKSDNPIEQQRLSRNVALLRTSLDGSILPLHGADTTAKASVKSPNVVFLRLVSKEQAELNYHLVLSDYCNESQNFVVLGANALDSSTPSCKSVDIPVCEHFSSTYRFLSLKLDSAYFAANQTQELTSFLCHILSHSSCGSLQIPQDIQSSTKCMFHRTGFETPTFHGPSSSSMKRIHSSSTNDESVTEAKNYTPDSDPETNPKVISNNSSVKDDNKKSESGFEKSNSVTIVKMKMLPEQLNLMVFKGNSYEADFSGATSTCSEGQLANIQIREASANVESSLNLESSSLSDFNLIPNTGLQQLPRYFLVKPQEDSQIVPTPPLEERSPPSGCSQDQILIATQNITATGDDRDNIYIEEQRLNIQFADGRSTEDTAVCQDLSFSSNFNLIPTDALQELPRYFAVHSEDAQGPPTEDRSQPSGCSVDNIQNIFNENATQLSTESNEAGPLDNIQDQEDTVTQTWSFQSDDMFGD